MNIFYLDKDPVLCSQYHCDKHNIKMILETAQLLCTTQWICGNSAPYKITHKNHPCSVWVRSNINNYMWLCSLGIELCKEYTIRYSKTHKSEKIIRWCMDNPPELKNEPFTEPPLAMPDHCKTNSVIESYRNYYIKEKSHITTWKTKKPEWFIV